MDLRIAPPGAVEAVEILERLVNPESGRVESIFKSKQKLMMFAAALGWHVKARKPLEKRGENPIRYDIFENAVDDGFVNALALAETGDLRVLDSSRDQERVRIFEEYANGGFSEMHRVLSAPGDSLEQLVQLISDAEATADETSGVRPDLVKAFNL